MHHANRFLNWSQRIALIRHTLHAAVRSGDFTFFKTLQAQGFLEGINYVGILTSSLGDDADALITALEDLNAALAQIFEDSFKTVYTKWKHLMSETDQPNIVESRLNLYVDTSMQRQIADMAIDKTTNSVIALIESQPTHVQETAASVWIGGVATIADAIEICLIHMDSLDKGEDDFIRMENSWTTVATSVGCAITALRGIYNLMDSSASDSASECSPSRAGSFSAASAASGVFRRLSNAFNPPSPAQSRSGSFLIKDAGSAHRSGSVPPDHRFGSSMRSSVSSAVPSLNERIFFQHTNLTPIPPTPGPGEAINPFEREMSESDEVPTEPTSTLVLTSSSRRFIDIRINLPKPDEPDLPNEGGPLSRLQWAFAGTSHTSLRPSSDPTIAPTLHCTWHHWIDSHAPPCRDDEVKDSGDLFPQPDGRSLETGTMLNPATGKVEAYEEMWSDGHVTPIGKEEGKRAVILDLREVDAGGREWAKGMVVRVGKWVQGIVKVVREGGGEGMVEVSCERWEYAEKGWERRVKIGRLWLPCAITWEEGVRVGKEVRYGDWNWVVMEADVW
ncbi:Hypothetical protein D9617_10g072620 [Elsinoe fawcettii]|nr:Hypothetical protein D9617_10g072620 [Elsinoe fawcettii]